MSRELVAGQIVLRKLLIVDRDARGTCCRRVCQLHAAERVTLRNGFVQQCDHHAQVDGRVRLYLSAGEDNYIEFGPEEIATFEFGSRSSRARCACGPAVSQTAAQN